jgi:hypothetical protein
MKAVTDKHGQIKIPFERLALSIIAVCFIIAAVVSVYYFIKNDKSNNYLNYDEDDEYISVSDITSSDLLVYMNADLRNELDWQPCPLPQWCEDIVQGMFNGDDKAYKRFKLIRNSHGIQLHNIKMFDSLTNEECKEAWAQYGNDVVWFLWLGDDDTSEYLIVGDK